MQRTAIGLWVSPFAEPRILVHPGATRRDHSHGMSTVTTSTRAPFKGSIMRSSQAYPPAFLLTSRPRCSRGILIEADALPFVVFCARAHPGCLFIVMLWTMIGLWGFAFFGATCFGLRWSHQPRCSGGILLQKTDTLPLLFDFARFLLRGLNRCHLPTIFRSWVF